MRKLSAHFLIQPGEKPIKNGILELDDDGTIRKIRQNDHPTEEDRLEFYNGVLVPGFVNVHTHLELSALKGKIPEHTGISAFIEQVGLHRKNLTADPAAIRKQLDLMFLSGIQAIGDISNTSDSLTAKIHTPVKTHTFVELFGLNPDTADAIWESGKATLQAFREAALPASLTPHAPYSLSRKLWEKFKTSGETQQTLSVHHMESAAEEELITRHSGKLAQQFLSMGIPPGEWPGPADSSTAWLAAHLPKNKHVLLIHNTFAQMPAIQSLTDQHPDTTFYFGLCPNANQYIENRLPHEMMTNRHRLTLCIGTDSLASNHQLSVWEEIKTLASEYPEIPIEEWIQMGGLNGAKALQIEKSCGSFDPGKKPGVVCIEQMDLSQLRITPESRPIRII